MRADAHHNPELFWALRGGGGNFGVVTAMEFELLPVADVYAGTMLWPWEQAEEVFHAFRYFARTVPDDVTSLCRLLQLPDLPGHPRAAARRQVRRLRGRDRRP